MDKDSDGMMRKEKDGPLPDNMLEEADYLNEKGLGHPLNLMCSLYYEVTTDDPPYEPDAGIGK